MSQTDFLPTGPELTVVIPVYNEEQACPCCSHACTRRSMLWA